MRACLHIFQEILHWFTLWPPAAALKLAIVVRRQAALEQQFGNRPGVEISRIRDRLPHCQGRSELRRPAAFIPCIGLRKGDFASSNCIARRAERGMRNCFGAVLGRVASSFAVRDDASSSKSPCPSDVGRERGDAPHIVCFRRNCRVCSGNSGATGVALLLHPGMTAHT